jgi:hypothetical protein
MARQRKMGYEEYCQYLLVTQINYTGTYMADHTDGLEHDAVKRALEREKLTPRRVWEAVESSIERHECGLILFDDTVSDKHHSFKIDTVRRQYSGNAHGIIKGIGIVNCVYVNPVTGKFWVIDYRIYDPDTDGKSKLDHMKDMLLNVEHAKKLPYTTVLMDSWYATKDTILFIESLGKSYWCPIKSNRLVDDSQKLEKYKSVTEVVFDIDALLHGKIVKIKGFPRDHKVRLFRVVASNGDTEYVVTNQMTQKSTEAAQLMCSIRWKIEQFHREIKQVTGLEKCQCRKARIQRNHIACAMLVWVRLKQVANEIGKTIYALKQGLLDDYITQQLKNPSIKMNFA